MTDLAWRLLRHGYSAVARDRAGRGASDDYPSRLLGRRALVVRSHDGVRTFYDEAIVRRKGAVAPPLAWLLFGRGAVHDAEHRARKRLLFDLTAPSGLIPGIDAAERHLRAAAQSWPATGEGHIYDQLVSVYGRAGMEWGGVRLNDEEADRWSRRLAAIVDGSASRARPTSAPGASGCGASAGPGASCATRAPASVSRTAPPWPVWRPAIWTTAPPPSSCSTSSGRPSRWRGSAPSPRFAWPNTPSGASGCSRPTRARSGWPSRRRSAGPLRSCRPSRAGYGSQPSCPVSWRDRGSSSCSTWSESTATPRATPTRRRSSRSGSSG